MSSTKVVKTDDVIDGLNYVNTSLRKMNNGEIKKKNVEEFHRLIIQGVYNPYLDPNTLDLLIKQAYARGIHINFYNNILIYLYKYLKEFPLEWKMAYMEYVCKILPQITDHAVPVSLINYKNYAETAEKIIKDHPELKYDPIYDCTLYITENPGLMDRSDHEEDISSTYEPKDESELLNKLHEYTELSKELENLNLDRPDPTIKGGKKKRKTKKSKGNRKTRKSKNKNKKK